MRDTQCILSTVQIFATLLVILAEVQCFKTFRQHIDQKLVGCLYACMCAVTVVSRANEF